MIPILTLSYELDQRLNKLSTFNHQVIQLEDKVIALNNAQIKLLKNKISGNNVYSLGLDAFKKRYQDLQFLIENAEDHSFKPTEKDKNLHKWVFDTHSLTPHFMFYIDSYLLATKGECKNRVIYVNSELVKHADINLLLTNTNYTPSFEYQETFADISSDEIHYYTDGTWTINKGFVSYIRYPKDMDIAGYEHFDGAASTNVDCEFEDYLKNEILDYAVEELAMFTENQQAVQNTQNRIKNNE